MAEGRARAAGRRELADVPDPHRQGPAEATASGESVLVVTHGGCIRAVTAHLIGADRLKLGPPANASLTLFEIGARVRLQAYGLRPQGPETPGIS